jgi:hypothetical protein
LIEGIGKSVDTAISGKVLTRPTGDSSGGTSGGARGLDGKQELDSKPSDIKPTETKSLDTKSPDTKPLDTK